MSRWTNYIPPSLQEKAPQLVPYFHVQRNHPLTVESPLVARTRLWWQCPVSADHIFAASLFHRIRGSGCPCCVGRQIVQSNTLAALYPALAQEWHVERNGIVTAFNVTPSKNMLVWWKCRKNPQHEWQATLNNRSVGGTACPLCAVANTESAGEKAVADALLRLGVPFEREARFTKCRHKRLLPFDFKVLSPTVKLIEFHGVQHYRSTSFFGCTSAPTDTCEAIRKRDAIKESFCNNEQLPLLVIPYWNMNKVSQLVQQFLGA